MVNTEPNRARQYFTYRPTPVLLAADPEAATHRDFGLPAMQIIRDEAAARWPDRVTMRQVLKVPIEIGGESAPTNLLEAVKALNTREGFELTEVDERIMAAHWTLIAGHFLIDRQGVVRWARVEGAGGIESITTFPGDDEILTAARGLVALQ